MQKAFRASSINCNEHLTTEVCVFRIICSGEICQHCMLRESTVYKKITIHTIYIYIYIHTRQTDGRTDVDALHMYVYIHHIYICIYIYIYVHIHACIACLYT